MSFHVLANDDVARLVTMKQAVEAMEECFLAQAEGALIAPARFQVDSGMGALVFTAGAMTKRRKVVGFRAYNARAGLAAGGHLTAVFDSENGALVGIITGELLGAVRTGAIGGVAVKHLSRPDSRRLGIIGTGIQARTQLEAAVCVRQFDSVKVYSRDAENRQRFADEMRARLSLNITSVGSAEEAVRDADVLVSATPATSPIYQASWLKPGVHINALGVKFKKAHEIGLDVVERSGTVVTDSLAQVNAYGDTFLLADTPHQERLIELSEVVAGKRKGRTSPADITLFCSMGLAGTEVVLADRVFQAAGKK